MEQENVFSYTYSASANQEVLNIRKKYWPQEESKVDELKRLDHLVQNSGVIESLSAGMMTTFSVYNLARNNVFDYSKAQRELGYTTRPYQETIHDEVQWMIEEGLIEA